jgi:1-deoxy-D-xylulose-5-phosphate synthase
MRTLGIPDRYIEHGERGEILAELGIDANGIANVCKQLSEKYSDASSARV